MRSARLLLLICVSTIFAIGLIVIFSASSAEVLDMDLDRSTHQAFLKQIYYAIAGLFLAFLVSKIDYRFLIKISPALLLFFSFLLILTLIPGVGKEVNGSRRWLSISGFSFQPSEFVKYIIPAFFINAILKRELDLKTFYLLVGIIAVPMVLILIEPNNGTTMVIGLTLLISFLLTRIPFKYWGLPLFVFFIVGSLFAYHLPYVTARLKVYLHPELDLKGKGHQPYQAKIAAGSGKFVGRGPGNSLQKLSYLPEAQNDYIAAIYAEEFGFLGISILILLYMLIAYLGYYIAIHCQIFEGMVLAGCLTFLISFQAFLNLGVVSGLLPSTGLNLPWFSQGGSSLMANFIGIGIIYNISIQSDSKSIS